MSRVLPWRAPRRHRAFGALAAVVMTIAAPFVALGPAYAGIGVGPIPDFPPSTTVGQPFTGRVNLFNNSTPPTRPRPSP